MPPHQHSPKIFYGWWIVGACFFIALYMAGVVFYGFTAIFEPIAEEFGWSYTEISIAASIRGLEAGLLAPVVGILVDRWVGTKKTAIWRTAVNQRRLDPSQSDYFPRYVLCRLCFNGSWYQ